MDQFVDTILFLIFNFILMCTKNLVLFGFLV